MQILKHHLIYQKYTKFIFKVKNTGQYHLVASDWIEAVASIECDPYLVPAFPAIFELGISMAILQIKKTNLRDLISFSHTLLSS